MGEWLNPGWDTKFATSRVKDFGLDLHQRAGTLSGGQQAPACADAGGRRAPGTAAAGRARRQPGPILLLLAIAAAAFAAYRLSLRLTSGPEMLPTGM